VETQLDIAYGITTLLVTGEIDLAVADDLRIALDEACAATRTALLIDLYGVDFCDSSGVAQFVRAAQTCAEAGVDCYFTNASPIVQRVFHASGLDGMLRPVPRGNRRRFRTAFAPLDGCDYGGLHVTF
jgi:anti-anti-sigma factor